MGNTSFYTKEELSKIGFNTFGKNVLISRKCSIYSPEKITIGNNVRIDDFCILSGNITLGSYIHIAAQCCLYGSCGIVLNDFSGLSSHTIVYSAMDDFSGNYMISPIIPKHYTNVTGGLVTICRYSQIGANCVVFPNVIVGEGCAIGSMSLINKSLDEWGIYVGIPCKRIKDRSKKLLELEKLFNNEQGDE